MSRLMKRVAAQSSEFTNRIKKTIGSKREVTDVKTLDALLAIVKDADSKGMVRPVTDPDPYGIVYDEQMFGFILKEEDREYTFSCADAGEDGTDEDGHAVITMERGHDQPVIVFFKDFKAAKAHYESKTGLKVKSSNIHKA